MKRYRRSNRKGKKKISTITLIILTILAIVLIGDVVGAIIYIRQSPEIQENLISYTITGQSLSFFQIFWQQFLYQLTIWTLGLTIIGNIINLFLIFIRGISAGFNLALLADNEVSLSIILLWLAQYIFILFTTILSVYFSLRFSYLVIKSLLKKKYKLLKKYLKLYAIQLLIIAVFCMVTSILTFVITPRIQEQISVHPQLET